MKIGFLITTRLKSTRLPFKVLKILNGRTVIERIIDRAKEVRGISEVILCTSVNPQDKPLIDIAKRNAVRWFTGDEDDVLKRLLDAAKSVKLDYFLGITADNPLMSIYHANLIVDEIKRRKFDFIKLKGLPIGAAAYGMRAKALETVCKVKNIIDTEIWGYLIDKEEIFDIKTINARGKLNRPELRFTLDYEEDYKLINNIYSSIPFKKVISLDRVIDYLDRNPDIAKVNQGCIQLQLGDEVKKAIDDNYKGNIGRILEIKNRIYSSA